MKKNNYPSKINYNNLILSAGIGYKWNNLKIFIKSLRKVSNDRVIIIVDDNFDKTTKEKFTQYKIEYYNYKKKKLSNIPGLKNSKSDIGQRRYEMYFFILKNLIKKPKKVFLTDSRDVVFQSNIFNNRFKQPLNFFLEKEKILNDTRNTRWLKRTVGTKIFDKIKNNLISCSGTTYGNFDEILNYSLLMKKNLYLFPYKRPLRHQIIFKNVAPYDQGIHNYLIYNKFFKDFECHNNNISKICTTAYMKKFRFNKKGQLINKAKKIYSIIHQYDRSFKKNGSPVFNFLKKYE